VKDILFRYPAVECNEAVEKLKEGGSVRSVLFTNASLLSKVKGFVSSELTNGRNYLKKKLFLLDTRVTSKIDTFVNFLFSANGNQNTACFDEELKKSAACLRYYRDSKYNGWQRQLTSKRDIFISVYLKDFYKNYKAFLDENIAR